ncbi:MAG TPA: hypothetical protein VHM92_12700 [Allosphingosinicella sp.]|nr:hypothetical protein [Allosphingosinicella sp.]
MKFYGLSLALPVVGVCGYAAMPDSGTVYSVPVEQAYSKLASLEMDPSLQSLVTASDELTLSTEAVPNQAVVWKFLTKGDPVGEVRADLSASGPGKTRIKVSFHLAEAGPLKHHAEFVNQQELISSYININLEEQIGATLEGRPFDESKVGQAMAQYALSHPQAMMKFGYDMSRMEHDPRLNGHDASLAFREMREEMGADSPRPDDRAEAARAKMQEASRPAVDLSKYR